MEGADTQIDWSHVSYYVVASPNPKVHLAAGKA